MARLTRQQLEELYVRWAPVVYRRAFALLNHETDSWEVVRDVFERMREVPTPDWVSTTTVRVALRAMRAPTHPIGLKIFELAETLDRDALAAAAAKLVDEVPESEEARAASEKSPGYARVKAQVVRERPPRWRELMPFIVPAVFTVVCFGVISIDLGGPRPGDDTIAGGRFTLAADAGLQAVVLTVDKDRRIEELFSGAVPARGLDLPAPPGPVAIHAFVSSQPLESKSLVPAMENSIREYGGYPLEAPPPRPDGVTVISKRVHGR